MEIVKIQGGILQRYLNVWVVFLPVDKAAYQKEYSYSQGWE